MILRPIRRRSNRLALLVGLHITVSNDGSAISAADALALTGITGFAPGAHTLSVADTGAAIASCATSLFGHGFPNITILSGNFAGIAAQLLDPVLHVAHGATVTMTGAPHPDRGANPNPGAAARLRPGPRAPH